ncbi:MAG: hypothetical protein M3N25_08845 [Actinomycetota bacterium]|nr:hypothetical protein [Actinomycetota bacterium]
MRRQTSEALASVRGWDEVQVAQASVMVFVGWLECIVALTVLQVTYGGSAFPRLPSMPADS